MTTYRLAGVDVPRIGLGTNRLTTGHVAFIRDAVAAGVRHIDTAHLYTGGESERAIGEALEGAAADVLVATKGGYRAGEGRPEVLGAQIEQSLQSLRTEAIGLYYLHRVDPQTPLEESLGAIKAYVDRGAIRHVGISEVSVEQIERARQVVPIEAVQNRYNHAERGDEDVVEYCTREGIAFVPFYPLSGDGGLTNTEKLAWLLGRSPVVLPIPGTLSIEHLRENLQALDA
jgi:pyridoxine 4-dehydrogenase